MAMAKNNDDVRGVAEGVGRAGASILGTLAGGVADYYTSQANAKQQQQWTRENMQQALKNQHELNRSATSEAVQGLRDAGLSVAGARSPVAAAASPSGQSGAKIDKVDLAASVANLHAIEQETQLKAAETELVKSQAQEQRIVNNRENTADDAARQTYIDNLEEAIQFNSEAGIPTDWLESRLAEAKSDPNFNLGTISGGLAAAWGRADGYRAYTDSLQAELDRSGVIQQLYKFEEGSLEYQLTKKELALKGATLGLIEANTENARAELPNIKRQLQKLNQEISTLAAQGKLSNAQANAIRNSDPYTAFAEGRYGAGLAIAGGKMLEAVGSSAGTALGAVAGAKVGGAFGAVKGAGTVANAAGSTLKTLSQTGTRKARKYNRDSRGRFTKRK